MAYRELGMVELREILRRWISGDGLRAIARATGMDRKTIAVYVRTALAADVQRGGACRPPPLECSDVCGDGQGDEDSRRHPGAGPKPSPAASERTPRDARSIVWASLKVSPKDG
jgi:hypothetical protein